MAKGLNISFTLDRTTALSIGLSAAAHIAAIGGLATVVVKADPSFSVKSAGTLLGLDSHVLPNAKDREVPPPQATPRDMERLLAKVIPEPPKAETPEELRIRLGVDNGEANTDTWVGFDKASEHRAVKAPVEQSALTTNAGMPGELGPVEPVQPESQTPNKNQSAQQQETQAKEQAAREGAGQHEQGNGSAATDREHRQRQEFQQQQRTLAGPSVSVDVETSEFSNPIKAGKSGAEGEQEQQSRERKERIEESKETKTGAQQRELVTATNPTAEPGAKSSPKPVAATSTPKGDDKVPGIVDEGEAEGTSLTEPVDIVLNGRVAAAKGLKIRTVQPEWAVTTRLTARPRSPQVLITFNKSGKVVRASFTPGKSTGYDDVDQPLLNSIFKWTARGETLAKLAAASPRAELTITVNVLFP